MNLALLKNLELTNAGNSSYKNIARIELEENFEKAKPYVDKNYPNLKGKLEQGLISLYQLKHAYLTPLSL